MFADNSRKRNDSKNRQGKMQDSRNQGTIQKSPQMKHKNVMKYTSLIDKLSTLNTQQSQENFFLQSQPLSINDLRCTSSASVQNLNTMTPIQQLYDPFNNENKENYNLQNSIANQVRSSFNSQNQFLNGPNQNPSPIKLQSSFCSPLIEQRQTCSALGLNSTQQLNQQSQFGIYPLQIQPSNPRQQSPHLSYNSKTNIRADRKAIKIVEAHSQFNSYVSKINEHKNFVQQQQLKAEEERLRQQQKYMMVNSMVQSQQQLLNQQQIQNLFKIDDLEMEAQSLTPTREKLFGESANATSSVNKYFAQKHNQTLDRINYLKNLKVQEETRECTHRPKINKKSVDMALRGRNDKAMENLKSKVYNERGLTFSPHINDNSKTMKRGVQQLLVWNEIKKHKQSEKKQIFDHQESLRKSSFVNNHSRELLRQKNEREIRKFQEERFDRGDILKFSPSSKMVASPQSCMNKIPSSQMSSQKTISLHLNTFISKQQSNYILSNPSTNKLDNSTSNSQLDTLTAYSKSTNNTITSPKMNQFNKFTHQGQSSYASDANTSASRAMWGETSDNHLRTRQIGLQNIKSFNTLQRPHNQYQSQILLNKQDAKEQNLTQMQDYNSNRENQNVVSFFQPSQYQSKNQKYLEYQSSQKKTFDTQKDYDYSKSHQIEEEQQNIQQQQQLQQYYEEYQENEEQQDQSQNEEQSNDVENEYGSQDIQEKMNQAKEIRESMGNFSGRPSHIITNNSTLPGTIMVKGSYMYDQNEPTQSEQNMMIIHQNNQPIQQIHTTTASFNHASNAHSSKNNSITPSLNASQSLTEGANSTFSQNLNNISGIGSPPQQTIIPIQSSGIYGSSDGLKLSFNNSQTNQQSQIQTPIIQGISQNTSISHQLHPSNNITQVLAGGGSVNGSLNNHLNMFIQGQGSNPQQQFQHQNLSQPIIMNQIPQIPNQLMPVAAAHFFSLMMQQTMQQQQNQQQQQQQINRNQSDSLINQHQISQGSISSPQNFPQHMLNILVNNQQSIDSQQMMNSKNGIGRLQTPQFNSAQSSNFKSDLQTLVHSQEKENSNLGFEKLHELSIEESVRQYYPQSSKLSINMDNNLSGIKDRSMTSGMKNETSSLLEDRLLIKNN
ncbi:UNKNOWN [Stylonychia lemnae]|uniref:Uncharacterized protein n=1 Tax=Stylonychia lemnae TaxID=5949 RepID=A0A078A6R5_STYLE|nr:UNKNOWN [Stylonychia lemnae]|eukprot:CDW77884.1 UNKNOWN [Stylonychia lemnae]